MQIEEVKITVQGFRGGIKVHTGSHKEPAHPLHQKHIKGVCEFWQDGIKDCFSVLTPNGWANPPSNPVQVFNGKVPVHRY